MATSSKDIETLWQRYSAEGSKKGNSVRDFFEKNGVPYHVFEKWYKRKYQHPEIVDCKVTGFPDIEEEQPEKGPCNGEAPKSKAVSYICITFINGTNNVRLDVTTNLMFKDELALFNLQVDSGRCITRIIF